EGLPVLEMAATLDPDNPILRWTLGYTLALLGEPDSARGHADWMHAHAPTMPYSAHLVALLHALDGRADDAITVLRTIEAMHFDAHLTFHLGEVYALAGDAPTALRLLGDAVERGFHPSSFIAEHCMFLAPLRGTAGFDRLA